ncbi:hypothetical protein TrVE_jg10154 [Triparma verrucosa]|uniref:UBL3-like ubiquitin domain-containing protein n=1 Tax=Triparma verrucosa TaxID=1606542 RepID=A0A9W7B8B9_9STRA|nr:hypothetical protein TrVE_jg10154 [Triparma verrucosa]
MSSINLKFIFAHNDGLHLLQTFPLSSSLSEVEDWVLQNWPSSLGAGPEDREWLRLICMGLGILQPSNSKLEALNLPTFDYPTPVNCSVRMKKKAEPKKKKIITQTNNGSVIESGRNSSTCFCTIM